LTEAINNTEYLYAHLPARMRRDDVELFLKRFLTAVGTELDGFDDAVDNFYKSIDAATASQKFIDFFLYAFFGWGWFPPWFTDERRRAFYSFITRHYARRGTVAGIQEFLGAFGLRTIVQAVGPVYGEQVYGEDVWAISGPLGIIVRLFSEAPAVSEDLSFYIDEGTFGESFYATPSQSIQHADLDELLRFVHPLGNIIMIEDLQSRPPLLAAPLAGSHEYGTGEYGSAEAG
jgi:phage tail-like protein